MNSYKVTYILNGEEHYDHITERTEKAAQKRVKGTYKDAEITDTELTSTDANATKEQERETLEKIKAMVEELGPQSYLKTAFDGVYEVAEMNIEEDTAYSFPGQVDALKGRQLPAWLHSAAYGLAVEELAAAQKRMEQSAETMAYYAEAPQDIAFAEAVKSYRAAKERRGVCEQIVKGLEALTEE